MIVEESPNSLVYRFESFGEFVEHVDKVSPEGHFKSPGTRKSRHENYNENDWAGTKTWDESIELAQNGWPLIHEKISKIYKELDFILAQSSLEWQSSYDVAGSDVDVNRFLSNEPECMINYYLEENTKLGKILKVLINVSHSWQVSSQAIMNRGIAAAYIINYLENQGFRCDVDMYLKIGHPQRESSTSYVKLKNPDDLLDTDKLFYAICNASILRRLFFSLMESFPDKWQRILSIPYNYYGFPCDVSEEEKTGIYDLHLKTLTFNPWAKELVDEKNIVSFIDLILKELNLKIPQ